MNRKGNGQQHMEATDFNFSLSLASKPTRSKSSFGTVSSFETFPWNFFDKYERTSLSQFCKYSFQLVCMSLKRNVNNIDGQISTLPFWWQCKNMA